jgi:ribosomal protein S1
MASTSSPSTKTVKITKMIDISTRGAAESIHRVLTTPIERAKSADEVSPSERAASLSLFGLHNSSTPPAGVMVKARVLQVKNQVVMLHTGIKVAKVANSEITPDAILERSTVDPSPRSPGEVRPGDIVKVFVEHQETPEGDMMVGSKQAVADVRARAVWNELESRMRSGQTVRGRILNSLFGGYAVGVAGLVCFLPSSSCLHRNAARIGELMEFRITRMTKARKNVLLRDVAMDRERSQRRWGQQQWRPQGQPRQRSGPAAAEAAKLQSELEGVPVAQ